MSQVSDLSFLKTFTSGDAAKISKYVNMFLKAAPASLSEMEQQVANGDWKSLKTNAHSLKSQLKYMGVASGEAVAQDIERCAGDQIDLEAIPGKIGQLSQITLAACEELKVELAKL